jgi:PAS domain S-box-containing protein
VTVVVPEPLSARRLAILGLAIAVAYVFTARLGFEVAFVAEQVTTVWAPSGISVAALILWRRRLWPAVWVGALVANLGTNAPLWTAAVIATGNTLEAVAATWLLRRDPAFDPLLPRLRDAGRLIALGALGATAISATVGVATLCAAAVEPWSRFADLLSAWWLGDALGVLVVTPAILTVAGSRPSRAASLRLVFVALGAAALTHAVFGQMLGRTLGEGLLHYVVFPLVVITAVRGGQPATALVIIGISAAAIANTLREFGPFAAAGLPRSLILLQTFMAVLAGTGLLLSSAMTERILGQRRLAGEQRRTRAILDNALDAVISMDHLGRITEFNPAAERTFGYHRDEALGRELADLIIPPEMRAQHRVGLRRHLETGAGAFLNRRVETRGYHADGHTFPIEVAIIRLSGEGPPTFTGFVRDLRERHAAENAVRSSEQRFRTLAASNSALTLYEQDRDLRYRWVFPHHPQFPDHNIGKTDDELLPPGEGAKLSTLKRSVLDSGVARREEVTVTLANGRRSYDLMIQPLRDPDGAIVGVSGVAIDITERKHTELLLRDRELQLREADRRKDEFLAMLAHELRNPLAPIRTGLEVLRLSGASPEAVERVRPMLERQVGHMVRLVDDLLDVSRISSGKIHLHRRPTSAAALVTAAVEACRAALDSAGVQLDVQMPEGPVAVDVDPVRFVQVLSNLLNNAAKFTAPGGRVLIRGDVSQHPEGAELALSVADTGIGIAPELLPRIFELFMQAEHSTPRSQGGLGIGLALARRIVELHGGRIDAHSAGPGAGSEFTVRIPVAAGAAEIEAVPRLEAGDRISRRRVLIVDDNEDSAEALAMLVDAIGGVAATAANGQEGILRAAEFQPDTIFLDIGMPGLDGYETCRRLRQQLSGRDVFIVALTGWGQARDKQRAADAGFNAHLTKPADPQMIERLLADDRTTALAE